MGESGQGLGETTGHGEYGFGSNEWMMAFAIKSANSNPHLSRGRREKEKMMSGDKGGDTEGNKRARRQKKKREISSKRREEEGQPKKWENQIRHQ